MSKVTIIAHIISIDSKNKEILRDKIPTSINIIDIDDIQRDVMHSKLFRELKLKLEDITKEIRIKNNFDINRENKLRIKQELIELWRSECQNKVKDKILAGMANKIIFVGYDIYPHSFNDKIEINVDKNKFILINNNNEYCKALIDKYINNYRSKIINGEFPLKYMNLSYLTKRCSRIESHYKRIGYIHSDLNNIINNIYHDINITNNVSNIKLYVTLPYDTGNEIVVDNKRKLKVYNSINEALEYVTKFPVYLYEVDANEFIKHTENYEISVNVPVLRKKKLLYKP